jgi:hypothetical protein
MPGFYVDSPSLNISMAWGVLLMESTGGSCRSYIRWRCIHPTVNGKGSSIVDSHDQHANDETGSSFGTMFVNPACHRLPPLAAICHQVLMIINMPAPQGMRISKHNTAARGFTATITSLTHLFPSGPDQIEIPHRSGPHRELMSGHRRGST